MLGTYFKHFRRIPQRSMLHTPSPLLFQQIITHGQDSGNGKKGNQTSRRPSNKPRPGITGYALSTTIVPPKYASQDDAAGFFLKTKAALGSPLQSKLARAAAISDESAAIVPASGWGSGRLRRLAGGPW